MGKGHSTGAMRGRASEPDRTTEQVAALPDTGSALDIPPWNGQKTVEIGAELICIRRRIADLDTWVNVPTSSYRGVTLRAVQSGQIFEILLFHMDPSLEVILSRTPDDTDVIALWRSYGRELSLPLLAEDRTGRLQPIEDAEHAAPFSRRFGSPLKSRRPRFLARRHRGYPSDVAVHRGEVAISFGA